MSVSRHLFLSWLAALRTPSGALFAFGLILFFVMAALGWQKLPYGFSFHDEGMYMADAWRLTAGDALFPDARASAVRLYVVFNALVFKLFPDITLLGFRQLQFFVSIGMIALLGFAVYAVTRVAWPIVWVASLFAFTGLDTLGIISNMSYYVYVHAFVTAHIAFLLFALKRPPGAGRNTLWVLSGVALWGMGFSVLPLVVTAASPLVLWGVGRWRYGPDLDFSARDAAWVLAPVVVLWGGFLALYGREFLDAVWAIHAHLSQVTRTSGINAWSKVPAYLAVAAVIVAVAVVCLRRGGAMAYAVLAGLAGVVYWVMDTNLGGTVPPYVFPWYADQTWLCALLAVTMGMAAVRMFRCRGTENGEGQADGHAGTLLVLLVPVTLGAMGFGLFSTLGFLALCFFALPAAMVLCVLLSGFFTGAGPQAPWMALATLLAVLLPVYHGVAMADWRNTFYDLSPKSLDVEFESGFAKGIRTNQTTRSVALWVQNMSNQWVKEDDLAIFYDMAPMGYMLNRLRPSLDHSWTGMGASLPLKKEAVENMKRLGREPDIAFRFINSTLIPPADLKHEHFRLFPGWIRYAKKDAVDRYVRKQMRFVRKLQVGGETWIECYVKKTPEG
ncbi:MAG: hypothetical protein ACE5FN_06855 [Leptospirillia bacterium]